MKDEQGKINNAKRDDFLSNVVYIFNSLSDKRITFLAMMAYTSYISFECSTAICMFIYAQIQLYHVEYSEDSGL